MSENRRALISRYEDGVAEVQAALADFPTEQLFAHPIPGKWSAAEIVHHLADSEMQAAIRIRRLICEPHPVIQAYDQELWAQRLHYNERPIGPSLAAFIAARESTVSLIRELTDEQWRHLGWHTESGSYHAETWLAIYADHAHGHAAQIRQLKDALA